MPAPVFERPNSSTKVGSSGTTAAKNTVSRKTIAELRRASLRSTAPTLEGSALPDRRVVGHQLALRAVAREPHHDDPTGLRAGHHTVAEGGVDDVVAEP